MNFKDIGLKHIDKRNKNRQFRRSYCQSQLKVVIIVNSIMLVYGLLYLLFLGPVFEAQYIHSIKWEYGFLTACAAFYLITSILLYYIKYPSIELNLHLYYLQTVFMSMYYLVWGLLCFHFSLKDGRPANLYVYLISLGFISSFFYFRWIETIGLNIGSYIIFCMIANSYPDQPLPDVAKNNMPIIVLLMTFLGCSRFYYAFKDYEAETKNKKLLEEQEAVNEELLSLNESLEKNSKLLENANIELRRSYDSQKSFTAAMNHELRSPLNGIIGNLQVAMLDQNLSDEMIENLDSCMSASNTLLGIVNDLLDLNKIGSGEFEILKAPFDLHSIVFNTMSVFKNVAANKKLVLSINVEDNTVCGLVGDDYRIQQIVNNIVSNAIKYTFEGSVSISFAVNDN